MSWVKAHTSENRQLSSNHHPFHFINRNILKTSNSLKGHLRSTAHPLHYTFISQPKSRHLYEQQGYHCLAPEFLTPILHLPQHQSHKMTMLLSGRGIISYQRRISSSTHWGSRIEARDFKNCHGLSGLHIFNSQSSELTTPEHKILVTVLPNVNFHDTVPKLVVWTALWLHTAPYTDHPQIY